MRYQKQTEGEETVPKQYISKKLLEIEKILWMGPSELESRVKNSLPETPGRIGPQPAYAIGREPE